MLINEFFELPNSHEILKLFTVAFVLRIISGWGTAFFSV